MIQASAPGIAGAKLGLAGQLPFCLGDVEVLPAELRLRRGREERAVEPLVMRCLVALNRRLGEVVPREELVFECWGDRIVGDDSVHQLLSKLRKLSEQLGSAFAVETIRGLGYRLDIPVARAATRPRRRWVYYVAALVMAAMIVGVVAAARQLWTKPPQPSLAVLPFRGAGIDAGGVYFAEAIGEEVLTLLSRHGGVRTIGGQSAARLGAGADFRKVRDLTGATHLLEGSVRRSGERVRINVRLLDTSDGSQLWAQSFERSVDDIFAVQEELAGAVVAQLVDAIGEGSDLAHSSTSLQVYDLYLRAHIIARERTYPAIEQAIRLSERAIALDPDYAPAHARLAIYRMIRDQQRPSGAYQDSAAELRETRAIAERAVGLNPDLAEAHAALGMLNWMTDPAQALEHHRRALALDPGNYLAWNNGGNALVRQCRPGEAINWYARAAEIEPLLLTPYLNLSQTLAAIGRDTEARAVAMRYVQRTGDTRGFHRISADMALAQSNASAAALHARAALAHGATDPQVREAMARGLYALGRIDDAVAALPQSERASLGAYWRGDHAAAARTPLAARARDYGADDEATARALMHTGAHETLIRHFRSAPWLVRDSRCLVASRLVPFVAALSAAGQSGQATPLLRQAQANVAAARDAGLRTPELEVARAEYLMIASGQDAALSALAAASTQGWSAGLNSLSSLSGPLFAPLAGRGEFAAIAREQQARQTRERAEHSAQLPQPPRVRFYQ